MRSIAVPPACYSRIDTKGSDVLAKHPNRKVWRYMDLAKLLALLEHQALFFTRADLFDDRHEGAITAHRFEAREEYHERQRRRGRPIKLTKHAQILVETAIQNTIINCWHISEHESDAMWKLYLSSRNGVAVCSTIGRLVKSLPSGAARGEFVDNWQSTLGVQVEPVRYIDYDSAKLEDDDMLLYKRKSFEHEKELRLLVHDDSMQGERRPTRFPNGGDYVPVKIDRLIETIRVAPAAPRWTTEIVQAIVRRYGFKFQALESALSKSPLI